MSHKYFILKRLTSLFWGWVWENTHWSCRHETQPVPILSQFVARGGLISGGGW